MDVDLEYLMNNNSEVKNQSVKDNLKIILGGAILLFIIYVLYRKFYINKIWWNEKNVK